MSSTAIRTMCPMNCHPTLCGMLVTTKNNQLFEIKGDKQNPDSQGFLCVRGQSAHEIINNPHRLLHPMMRDRRNGKDWQQVSWDDVMDRILSGIQKVGRESTGIWSGHGSLANDFGTFAHTGLVARFANMYGCQIWDASMICWGLGGFGLGLTGAMEANTKEDMGKHADLIILWGTNIASQPNSGRYISAAKRRGARVIAIDVRVSEACKLADMHLIVKPGTDAALALGLMQEIIKNDMHDRSFIDQHTLGFEALQKHLESHTPQWAADITGIESQQIINLAREYADTERAMIMLGGSSMYKDQYGWQASRAISCLPALTGKLGKPGTGFGPRHAGMPAGYAFSHIMNSEARPPGNYIPNQMSSIIDAIETGQLRTLLLFGTNMLSSFADSARIAKGLDKMELVVCHDLFMNETIRDHADIILPATAWLEDLGCKATATHLYLLEQVLEPAGETRSMTDIIKELAQRFQLDGFYPWEGKVGHIDAVLDHPSTGHATVASLRENSGIAPLNISHVAHSEHRYYTPSGKLEFYSERAQQLGLPAMPVYQARAVSDYPLELRTGRQLSHFHAFYDHGQALPSLKKMEQNPILWISEADASARNLENGKAISIYNGRGACQAVARITDDIPQGTVWMHDGCQGMNTLTSGDPVLPDNALNLFPFSAGQSAFDAQVDVCAI